LWVAEYDLTVANGVLGDGDGTHNISFFFTTDNRCCPLPGLLVHACHASSGSSKAPEPKPSACTASEPFVDESSDIQAAVSYKAAIRRLFAAGEFAGLDCIANTARTRRLVSPGAVGS
jgi:hypothetical protein